MNGQLRQSLSFGGKVLGTVGQRGKNKGEGKKRGKGQHGKGWLQEKVRAWRRAAHSPHH